MGGERRADLATDAYRSVGDSPYGFSFAKSMMEMYKQAQKKTVHKSQGMWKQLIGKSTGKGTNDISEMCTYTKALGQGYNETT